MAERIYINELEPGLILEEQIFCLLQKDLRRTSTGSPYIHAVLADRTGQVPARIWQADEELYKALPQDGFVCISGRTEEYKGSIQIIIEAIRPAYTNEVSIDQLLPTTQNNIDNMFEELKELLRTIKNRTLLQLVGQVITDVKLMDAFKRAPAAIKTHHAYIGGLLEHTLHTVKLADLITQLYPELNRDLLLAGAFLHDIGKLQELAYDQLFKYTDSGQLLGHLFIGARLIEEKAKLAEEKLGEKFPEELLTRLLHMILSHHGEYEFGSPKLPMTPEAIALHYIDNLDAKLNLAKTFIEKSNQTDPESNWTSYIKSLERPLFKGAGGVSQQDLQEL